MSRVLVDTDILSEIHKAKAQVVMDHAERYLAQHERLTFSSVTVMEVVTGFSLLRSEDKVLRFLKLARNSDVVPFDIVDADYAGRIYADLRRRGRNIGVPDTMIAAIAIRHSLPLVTGNTADYEHVKDAGYPLLLENWRVV